MGMKVSTIAGTVISALLVVGLTWVGTNVVWAEDLVRLEKTISVEIVALQRAVLSREVRDVSRELRPLLASDSLSESEVNYKIALEQDLSVVQSQLDRLDDD